MNNVTRTLYIPLYGKAYVSRKGLFLKDKKAEEIWEAEGFALKGKSKSKWLAYRIQPVNVTSLHSDDPRKSVLQMTLYEGRNRQIRKMCEHASLEISRLSRVAIGEVKLGSLPSGKWRRLTAREVQLLKPQEKG